MRSHIFTAFTLVVLGCQPSTSVSITADQLPPEAVSLVVLTAHGGRPNAADPVPFEIPQPVSVSATTKLILSSDFTDEVTVSVGAFSQPGGHGCLLATGSASDKVITNAHTDYLLPVGSQPTGIAAADFNQDGALDIVVGTKGDSMVRILLNDGKGNLLLGGATTVSMGVATMATADLNDDRIDDVVLANRNDNSITILFGNGKGGFKSQATVTQVIDPVSVAIADINFDGQLDILIGNYSTGSLTVLFNEFGLFGTSGKSKVNLPAGQAVGNALAIDVNNDKKPDFLAADPVLNQIIVIGNNGLPNVIQYTLPTEAGPRFVQAVDLNGDGFPDLVVPCSGSHTIDIFLNNRGKGFMNVKYKSYPTQLSSPQQAALYDADHDGRPDIGVMSQTGVELLMNRSGM